MSRVRFRKAASALPSVLRRWANAARQVAQHRPLIDRKPRLGKKLDREHGQERTFGRGKKASGETRNLAGYPSVRPGIKSAARRSIFQCPGRTDNSIGDLFLNHQNQGGKMLAPFKDPESKTWVAIL